MRLPLVRRTALESVLETLAAARLDADSLEQARAEQQARAERAEHAVAVQGHDLGETAADLARAREALDAATAPPELTAEEVAWYHQKFKDGAGCQTCGGIHARSCPRVRSVGYEARGDKVSIRKVTFWPPGKWDATDIVFSDQLPDPEEDDGE